MTTRTGTALLVLGVLVALTGWLMSGPEPVFGENILAGLLVVAGGVLAAVGAVLLVTGRLRQRTH